MSEYVGEFSGASEMVPAARKLLVDRSDLTIVRNVLTEADADAFLAVETSINVLPAEGTTLWYKTLPQDEVNAVVRSLWREHGTLDTAIGDFFADIIRPRGISRDVHADTQNGINYILVLAKEGDVGAELVEFDDRLPAEEEYEAVNRELERRFPVAERKDLDNFGVDALRSVVTAKRGDVVMMLDSALHAVNAAAGRVSWTGSHPVTLLHSKPQPV